MKLWQKLMPVATAAATVACVVPMASCGDSYLVSTSDKKFEPKQHSAVTDGYTQAEATEEYFKDAKNAANDYCYEVASSAKSREESQKKSEYVLNFENSISVGVTFTIGEEKKNVEINGTKYTGYMISGKINQSGSEYTESKLNDEQKKTFKKISEQVNSSYNLSASGLFAFLAPTSREKMPWGLYLYGIQSLDKNWSASVAGASTQVYTYESINGVVEKDTRVNNTSDSYNGDCHPNPVNILQGVGDYIDAYTFANVKVKA